MTTNGQLHATVNSKNGYLHINNLEADDVGIIYCDFGIIDFDPKRLRLWIESIDD